MFGWEGYGFNFPYSGLDLLLPVIDSNIWGNGAFLLQKQYANIYELILCFVAKGNLAVLGNI